MERPSKKSELAQFFNQLAPERDRWLNKNRFFYQDDLRYFHYLVPKGKRVAELGCGTGDLLSQLEPSYGVGLDISEEMIKLAREKHDHLTFLVGDVEEGATLDQLEGPFDYIILPDLIGYLEDVEETFLALHRLCTPETRIIITHYNQLWGPILNLGAQLGMKMPSRIQNWLTGQQICSFLKIGDFDLIQRERRQLIPVSLMGLGALVNQYIAPFPVIRRLCLRNFFVARPLPDPTPRELSTTVVIPCRNERGNVEAAIKRIPPFCQDMEILYVEGNSQDGTFEEIQRVIDAYPNLDIKGFQQTGKGKGDAVRLGFDKARGELLMILDADLTMPPEDLPKFYRAISQRKGEFINGSRLVYPMEDEAMRTLNLWANSTFSYLFSWLLNQPLTDTLCGTKVLLKKDYEQIAKNRSYFGTFDPFGDFDLLFGAAKANLKIREIPIRYRARSYGETQISRFRHGVLLLKMVLFAFRKLKSF
ncbi:MAG: glycosyltransferase [Magnetococcales bacterium]|nr:glycosyltransferase [Magnetococcales bacterium]